MLKKTASSGFVTFDLLCKKHKQKTRAIGELWFWSESHESESA